MFVLGFSDVPTGLGLKRLASVEKDLVRSHLLIFLHDRTDHPPAHEEI